MIQQADITTLAILIGFVILYAIGMSIKHRNDKNEKH